MLLRSCTVIRFAVAGFSGALAVISTCTETGTRIVPLAGSKRRAVLNVPLMISVPAVQVLNTLPKLESLLTWTAPSLMCMSPLAVSVDVLFPPRISVPAPVLVSPVLLPICELMVALLLASTAIGAPAMSTRPLLSV